MNSTLKWSIFFQKLLKTSIIWDLWPFSQTKIVRLLKMNEFEHSIRRSKIIDESINALLEGKNFFIKSKEKKVQLRSEKSVWDLIFDFLFLIINFISPKRLFTTNQKPVWWLYSSWKWGNGLIGSSWTNVNKFEHFKYQ